MPIDFQITYPEAAITDMFLIARKFGTTSIVKASDGSLLSNATANYPNAALTGNDDDATYCYRFALPDGVGDGEYETTVYVGATDLSLTSIIAIGPTVTMVNGVGYLGGPAKLVRAVRHIAEGVVTTGASTISVPTSSIVPTATVTDQFKGRILIFAEDTTTAALRGQGTDITSSSTGGTLTVTALTTTPASGDRFTIQ